MAKKLTAADLSKLTAKFNDRKTISVYNDQFTVDIHTVFRDSLMEHMIFDYLTVLQELQQDEPADGEMGEMMGVAVLLLNALILKEFTNLPIPKKLDAGKLVQITRNLLDTGIMQEVFQQFNPAELDKIAKKLEDASGRIGQLSALAASPGSAAVQPSEGAKPSEYSEPSGHSKPLEHAEHSEHAKEEKGAEA